MQPIRGNKDFKKNFSNEINGLLDYISNELINEYPAPKITTPMFLLASLLKDTSMLSQALKGFLNGIDIESIKDVIDEQVRDESLSGSRLGAKIEPSSELQVLFQKSDEEKELLGHPAITSDHVLMAFLKYAKKSDLIRRSFENFGINYERYCELSIKAHESAMDIAAVSEDAFAEMLKKISVDIGEEGQDKTGIAFITVASPNAANISNDENSKHKKGEVQYCVNLNSLAETGKIDTLIGRTTEIDKIVKIFGRKKCNNVLLVGKPGSGKSAIIEGLAKKIVEGTAPRCLTNSTIFKLKVSEIMEDSQFRGAFENKVNSVVKDLRRRKNSILVIENIQNVFNSQRPEFDFVACLTEIFDDPDIRVIVSTTPKGYHSTVENNEEILRKFQRINVENLSVKESVSVLKGIKGSYEKYHSVKYTDEAIESCVKLAERYITDRCLPSSAIDVMDEAGSIKKNETKEPVDIVEMKELVSRYEKTKEELIRRDDIKMAESIEQQIKDVNNKIARSLEEIRTQENVPEITVDDICKAISEHTNIPINKISVSEKKQVANIDKVLKDSIIGQDEAIDVVARAIKRNKVGLNPANRPIFSALCIGSTGVGKTLLAKKLATEIFGSEKYLVRIDMSEYSDKTAVNKLIGSSAGYVGYTEGGILTEKVKNQKYAVVLIDEIEKATEEIFNLFLQILDEGYLSDNMGQKVDFKNTILILTSNVGTKRAQQEKGIGFEVDDNLNKRTIIEKELKKKFPPEFINRLDEVVYFNALDEDSLKKIIELEMRKLTNRLWEQKYDLVYKDDAIDYILGLAKKEKEYGARPILKIIRQEIENKITDIILNSENQTKFKITIEDGKLTIQ